MPGKLGGACAGDTRFCSRVTPDGLLQRNSVQRCSHLIVLQKQILRHAPNHGNQARHQTQPSAISATPTKQNEGRCEQVPHLPRKKKANVTKCHACHANGRSMSPSPTPATQSAAASRATNGDQVRRQTQPSAISATPATQNEG